MTVGEAFVACKNSKLRNLGSPTPIQTANVSSIMVLWEAASPDFYRVWAATAYLGRGRGTLLGQRCWLVSQPYLCTERQLGIPRPSLTDRHLITSHVRFHTSRQPVAFQNTCSSLAFSLPRLKKTSPLNPSFKALFPNFLVFLFLDFLS